MLYYERVAAAGRGDRAAEFDREIDFDLVHHATFATYWTRAGVSELGKPFVWGPVGGGGADPPALLLCRAGRRRPAARKGSARRCAGSRVAATESSGPLRERSGLPGAERAAPPDAWAARDVTVLPNALTVRAAAARARRSPGARTSRSSAASSPGRAATWRYGHCGTCGTPTPSCGSSATGPTGERIVRAAERWGLQDRVDLVGSRAPRRAAAPAAALRGAAPSRAARGGRPGRRGGAGPGRAGRRAWTTAGPAELVRWWPTRSVDAGAGRGAGGHRPAARRGRGRLPRRGARAAGRAGPARRLVRVPAPRRPTTRRSARRGSGHPHREAFSSWRNRAGPS